MTNCLRIRPLLTGFLGNTLPDGDIGMVEGHLEECSQCVALLEAMDNTPPLSLPRADFRLESQMWAELERGLDRAWEEALPPPSPPATSSWWARLALLWRERSLAIPLPVAMGYVAVASMLLLWNLWSLQQSQVLTAQLTAKDETIQILRAAAGILPLDGEESVAALDPADPEPASEDLAAPATLSGIPDITGSGLPGDGAWQGGHSPEPYLNVVH